MKIIKISNYDRPIPDVLIAENVPEQYAKCIIEALIKSFSGNTAPDFFWGRPDDYKLRISPEDFE